MNEHGGRGTHGVVKKRKESHGRGGTNSLDESQPGGLYESIVATQFDEIVVVIGEERGSPSRTTETRGIPHSVQASDPLAAAMQGEIHQSQTPSWVFRGKLSLKYGNRKGERDIGECGQGPAAGGAARQYLKG